LKGLISSATARLSQIPSGTPLVKKLAMAIPITYNIRNMVLRSIALTVTTAVFVMMLLSGMNKVFVSSGNALNVLVLRQGTTSELNGFAKEKVPYFVNFPALRKTAAASSWSRPSGYSLSTLLPSMVRGKAASCCAAWDRTGLQ
jgi:hypothetical protein